VSGGAENHSRTAGPGEAFSARVIGFTRMLRDQGFPVGVQEGLDALRVARRCDITDRQGLHWGLRALLCTCVDEWQRFDELFDIYWRLAGRRTRTRTAGAGGGREAAREASGAQGVARDIDQPGVGEAQGIEGEGPKGGASAAEARARTDFQRLADQGQLREMEHLVERLARRMRRRIVRRARIVRAGRQVHMGRTVRNSLRYGGLPLDLAFRKRRRELPRLVLLLDVSRSMSLYSYLFLRFARGIVSVFRDADAFVYHTRLVRVTEALREPNIERVREKLAVLSLGWSGGTRIGACLERFNHDYGRRLLNRRTIVVMVSDGLDTGPPALLAEHLQRIRRRVRRVVWLNPLLGRAGYQPLAGGMQAALGAVDVFAPAHSLDSLRALEPYLVNG